jgi:hypothetical protein
MMIQKYIIFIFLEIVKFTKGTPICLNYFTNDNNKVQIEFGEKYLIILKLVII